ncbi:MAG: cytochrome c [Halothiobacillaceae bacterium]|nr:cytochrome c [Halothiobacillaceae bacterium]
MNVPSRLNSKVYRASGLIAALFLFTAAPAFSDGHAPALGAGASVTTPSMPGRLLASNCFQCHATNGVGGFDRLAGLGADEIMDEMLEKRAKSKAKIMSVHALGYSREQLEQLSAYLASVHTNAARPSSR